jgi:hypothetical protein
MSTVDGVDYVWEVKRYWGASDMYNNFRGLAIRVFIEHNRGKELEIEFPFGEYNWHKHPNKATLVTRISQCIPEARHNGWDPSKRGKPFRYEPESA